MTKTILNKQETECINIYASGKYETVRYKDSLYLTLAKTDKLEVIASLTQDKECVVYDRDLALCWLSSSTTEHRKLEKLKDESLKGIPMEYVRVKGIKSGFLTFDQYDRADGSRATNLKLFVSDFETAGGKQTSKQSKGSEDIIFGKGQDEDSFPF